MCVQLTFLWCLQIIHASSFKVDLDIIDAKRRAPSKQIPHTPSDSLN